MYWRAEFDERTGLITAWEDLIPSDDNECLGQSNASAIEAEARQHWLAVGRKDITRVMQLFSPAAKRSCAPEEDSGQLSQDGQGAGGARVKRWEVHVRFGANAQDR